MNKQIYIYRKIINFALLKIFYLVILGFCIFINVQEFLIQKFPFLSFVSSVDEVFALSAYVLAPHFIRKKSEFWVIAILLLPILSIIYGCITSGIIGNNLRLDDTIVQSFINVKFFLYFVVFYCFNALFNDDSRFISGIIYVCLVVSIVGAVVNFISPNDFIYSTYQYALERQRIIGFQFKPNDLAILLSFCFSVFLFLEMRLWCRLTFLIVTLVLIIYSTSRTALFISVASVVFYALYIRAHFALIAISTLAIIFSLLFCDDILKSFFVTETLSNLSEFSSIETSQYIRFIMVYLGWKLAFMYFPFGAGPATFGTVMSTGSPVYNTLGVSQMNFFQNMEGVFDSNIASIVGEYGIVGLVIFIYFSMKIFNYFSVGNKLIVLLFICIAIVVSFLQPLYSYQVNSINMLLLMFSMRKFLLCQNSQAKNVGDGYANYKR